MSNDTDVLGPLKDLHEPLLDNIHNPNLAQRATLDFLEMTYNGKLDLVDCTNPAVFLMEASAVQAAASLENNITTLSKMYPSLATTYDDLYLHMSNKDYERRFALPSYAPFRVIILHDSFRRMAVKHESGTYRYVTIPKDTQVKVGEHIYTLDYAIHIQQYQNRTLKVIYDKEGVQDEIPIRSNILNSVVIQDNELTEFLMFDMALRQIHKIVAHYDVGPSVVFKESIAFEQDFHSARAYIKNVEGTWVKVETSHSDMVFDPYVPTVIFTVGDKVLHVNIPPIYTVSNTMGSEIMIILYETQGQIDYDPLNLPSSTHVVTSLNLLRNLNAGEAAFTKIDFKFMPTYKFRGGRNELSFQELRDRTLKNTVGINYIPITPDHFEVIVEDYGFNSILYSDNLSGRKWVLSSPLPAHTDLPFKTDVGVSYLTIITSLDKLKANPSVHGNGNQATISAEMMYELFNSEILLHSKNYTRQLRLETNKDLAVKMNDIETRYSPFFYVAEYIEGNITTTVYQLDVPKANYINFYSRNNTVATFINTKAVEILFMDGYFEIRTRSAVDDILSELPEDKFLAQMTWLDPVTGDRIHVPSHEIMKNTDGSFVSRFRLYHNLELSDNNIRLTNARTIGDPRDHKAWYPLTGDIDFVFGTKQYENTFVVGDIDNIVYKVSTLEHKYPLTHERINITLGKDLTYLWRDSRILSESVEYAVYPEDIPMRYSSTDIIMDPARPVPFLITDDCTVEFTEATREGTIIVDENNEIVYLHRAGDTVIGPDGKPVIINASNVDFTMEVLVFDGLFYFTEDEAVQTYLDDVEETIVRKSTIDILPIIDTSLEHTEILYKPKDSMGFARIQPIAGELAWIDKEQYLQVVLYVERSILLSESSRKNMRENTISTINKVLERTTVSHSELIAALTVVHGDGVVGVSVKGLGGLTDDQVTMTLSNKTDKLYIAKKAIVDEQGEFSVSDHIEVTFLDYTTQ